MIGIYCRVSTQNQADEGYSLETQEELCMKKAKQLGFSIKDVKIYREEGRSGEDIDRPMMNDLRDDTANGLITKVIITDPDRLTRDLTDKLIVCKEWDRQGVEILFIDTEYQNTPEGQMFFNMRSVFAQYELAQIRKRTIRGRLRAVEKDKKIMPMRVAPYGYDYKDGELHINAQEAVFVNKIYKWYLEGQTLRGIGDKLYQEGALPKRKESKNFGATSISRILTSEIYIGKYIYNRRETKKIWGERTQSGKQKKTYKLRDESEWITVDVPPLIDIETFAKAQDKRQKNKRKGGNVKQQYLFKGMIRCKNCGRIWECTTYNGRTDKKTGEKKKYSVYRCPNLNPKRYGNGIEKCDSQSIRIELLESYIFDMIQSTLPNKEVFVEAIKKEVENKDDTLDNQIEELKNKIKKKEEERDRVKRMFVVAQVITEDEMLKDMKKINEDIKIFKEKIIMLEAKLQQQKQNELSKEQVYSIIQNIEHLFNNNTMKFEEKRQLMEILVQEIAIDAKSNPIVITIKGLLDDIASSTQYQKI